MILVAGATGSLGGKIVERLLRAGCEVNALVRPTSDSERLTQAGARKVAGDLRDAASLTRACAGVSVVISTASASKHGDDSVENVDGRGTQDLIEAARRTGVRHFILVSTLASAADSPVPVFRAKAASERRLVESGLAFTLLRCNAFMDVLFPMLVEAPIGAGMPVTLVGASIRRHSFVAERDVAAIAAAAAIDASPRTETLLIGGPEAVSMRDVVRAYEEALRRPIPVATVAPGEPIPGLPPAVWGMAAALETFDSRVPMEATARAFDIELTTVQAYARNSPLAAHAA